MIEALWACKNKLVYLSLSESLFQTLVDRNLIRFHDYHQTYIIQSYDNNYNPITIDKVSERPKRPEPEDFKVHLENGVVQQLLL